jgi:hypothetical protein
MTGTGTELPIAVQHHQRPGDEVPDTLIAKK